MSKKIAKVCEPEPKESLEKVSGKQEAVESIEDNKVSTGVPAAANPTEMKGVDMPKAVTNTKKVAELVGAGSVSPVGMPTPLLRAGGRINYSGTADNIGGDKSALTKGNAVTKSGDRPGRQIDTALQHIDDTPAETFSVNVETIPQLTDGSSVVGYNGKYRNAHAISQKGSGGSPADSDFFRTLDECQYDVAYYGDGQINAASGDSAIVGASFYKAVGDDEKEWHDVSVTEGNYLPRSMTVTFDGTTGAFKSISFAVDDLSNNSLDESVLRVAGDAHIRRRNLAELDRLQMIDKAGDETKDNWSALGKAIPNSRGTNSIMGDMDKIIGDYMFLSASKLSHGLAYQNNKAAKDGMRKVGPMFEMCLGNVDGAFERYSYEGDDENLDVSDLFAQDTSTVQNMGKGSAALYVAMMDSVQKYNTKGKILSLPLSFKTALSTFKQNCGELRAHSTFVNEFNRQETFGKIDSDATGITPYFISDGAGLIQPLNIFSGTLASASKSSPIFNLHYEDLRNEYNYPVWNYFIDGLSKFFGRYAGKIVSKLYHSGSADYVLTIPVVSTTTCLSLWDIILCAAAKDIAIARRYALDIVCQYEANNGYPYSGAVKLSDVQIGGTAGIGFTDISEPLQARPVALNVAARLLLPETFWVHSYAEDDAMDGVGGTTTNNGVVGQVLLPWYFSQNAFAVVSGGEDKNYKWDINPDGLSSMTFFDYRGGVTFGNADRIRQMDPEQLKLAMDRMVVAPCMDKQYTGVDEEDWGDAMYPVTYKYSLHEDGIPCLLYRIASKGTDDASHDYSSYRVTIADIMRAPRELGLSFIAPAGVLTPTYSSSDGGCVYRKAKSGYFTVSGPSFRLRFWTATGISNIGNTLFDQERSSSEAINLMAKYYLIEATPSSASTDIGIKVTETTSNGVVGLSSSIRPFVFTKADGGYIYSSGTYDSSEEPVQDTEVSGLKSMYPGVVSTLKYLYTRLNILPFVINPFDTNTKAFTGSETTDSKKMVACNNYDIFEFLHLFNMCGFRCGEYSGAEFERNKARIELGLGYVEDPYIQHRL